MKVPQRSPGSDPGPSLSTVDRYWFEVDFASLANLLTVVVLTLHAEIFIVLWVLPQIPLEVFVNVGYVHIIIFSKFQKYFEF